MKKILLAFTISLISLFCITLLAAKTKPPVTVGIVIPVDVPGMQQIVAGFKTTLSKAFKAPVNYLVQNAQGDINIQRSILQELNSPKVNLIVPIGTDAAQMAIAMIHQKPIIGIGANHLKSEAKKANRSDVTGVISKAPPALRLQFIHAATPALNKLTVIYSADDRIFHQVNQFVKIAKQNHIAIQKLMVSQLSDLYTISKSIAADSQAIFILKDEVVVSGLNALLQTARQKHIPIVASDDGSVAKGAAFALGVSEYQSGVDAAKIAAQILLGKKARDIPVYVMKNYFVFLNPKAAKAQNINPTVVKQAANKLGYQVRLL